MNESLRVRAYERTDDAAWDEFVAGSAMGTFLHTRRFLGYHGARFRDASVVLEDEGKCAGLVPAAIDPRDETCIITHPGSTFGGLLTTSHARVADVEHMIDLVLSHYRNQGFRRLTYKSIPTLFHALPTQLDVYSLWRKGGQLTRCDLWNTIRLGEPRRHSKGHKWSLNKARKLDVQVDARKDDSSYQAFHHLLETCLAERHAAKPVHSNEEVRTLRDLFPDAIMLWMAHASDGELLATTWIFGHGQRAWHAQYIASSPRGRDQCAVDLLLETVIVEAESQGVRWFSFGACTEDGGRALNEGLYNFKASFGGGSSVQQFFEFELASSSHVRLV